MDDAELFVDNGLTNILPNSGLTSLTNSDPSARLTFGELQQMLARKRLNDQQRLLQEINRGPGTK